MSLPLRCIGAGHGKSDSRCTPTPLSALVNSLGVPTTADRTVAIREHVLEMPAPVVADTLG
ncbi:hypothetical protein GCM10010430_74160 [Kitasatospora cystarginea]|uniref:Uncharacterized protein n=1 Tax=Kitasatospora cystarginea TaxID=58350 RepID=A0ABN3EYU0_9ACTN